ncbi:hypothetical protein AVEN_215335-1 [Araneus ventricosus]|uniref:Uncharacterized protein n=1 Tax=Araneus ventricosus TaxID=182803 RepID=A0A4Y2GG45_ARAVE|nr:hypothetical protein AVEN_215335-1 [Araneus ventricosus]
MAASGRSRVGGCDVTCIRSIHYRYSVELDFEPGALRPESRDLTTGPTHGFQEINPLANIYLCIETRSVIRQPADASRKRLSLIGLR